MSADRLRAYAQLYAAVLASGRMCLCGMLASDFETLSPTVQDHVSAFFEHSYAWLERIIAEGVGRGRLPAPVSSRATAEALVAGLEGAMLVSRPSGDPGRFEGIAAAGRAAERNDRKGSGCRGPRHPDPLRVRLSAR